MTFPPGEDVFVGRRAELAQLTDMVARVRQGQPWLVTIEGESGVGKTAPPPWRRAGCGCVSPPAEPGRGAAPPNPLTSA